MKPSHTLLACTALFLDMRGTLPLFPFLFSCLSCCTQHLVHCPRAGGKAGRRGNEVSCPHPHLVFPALCQAHQQHPLLLGHWPTVPVYSWVECPGDPLMPPVPLIDLNPPVPLLSSVLFKWKCGLSPLPRILYLGSGRHTLLPSQGLYPFSPPSLLIPSMHLGMCTSFLSLRNILPQSPSFPTSNHCLSLVPFDAELLQ